MFNDPFYTSFIPDFCLLVGVEKNVRAGTGRGASTYLTLLQLKDLILNELTNIAWSNCHTLGCNFVISHMAMLHLWHFMLTCTLNNQSSTGTGGELAALGRYPLSPPPPREKHSMWYSQLLQPCINVCTQIQLESLPTIATPYFRQSSSLSCIIKFLTIIIPDLVMWHSEPESPLVLLSGRQPPMTSSITASSVCPGIRGGHTSRRCGKSCLGGDEARLWE